MADLEQMASLLKIDIPKALGKKRRSWIQDDNQATISNVQIISSSNKYISNKQTDKIKEIESKEKLDSGLDSKLDSLDSKLGSLDSGLDSASDSLDSKLDSGLGSTLGSKLDSRLDSGLDSNHVKYHLNLLTGRQLEILSYVLRICIDSGELTTGAINTYKMAAEIEASYGTTKDALNKLIKKGLLTRLKGKTSSQGFIVLGIPKEIKSLAIELKLDGRLSSRLDSKKDSALDSKFTANSNNINNKITITSDSENTNLGKENLPDEWESINYESLRHIGFSETQLSQLYSGKFNTPEIIQDSINHFAFGLENNDKTKGYEHPLRVLMGILRKGQSWTEPNYESATDRSLRLLLERRKQENERRENVYKELFELEYSKWFKAISDEDLKRLLPKADFAFGRFSGNIEMQAKSLFRQTKWEEIRNEITKEIEK